MFLCVFLAKHKSFKNKRIQQSNKGLHSTAAPVTKTRANTWLADYTDSKLYLYKTQSYIAKKVLLLGVHIRPKFVIKALFNHLSTFQLKN